MAVIIQSSGAIAEITGISQKVILSATLGNAGWSPILSLISDGNRRVLQVSDWVGGSGSPPAIGGYIGNNGIVLSITDAINIRGEKGEQGEPSPSYLHTQSTNSDSWLINHNLNAYPQIQLFSLGWIKIYADEQHLSLNTTQVSFSYPAVGYAILSL
jgi:hypothetical protein